MKNKVSKILILLLVIVGILVFTAQGYSQEKKVLSFATAGTGGSWYYIGAAISNLINKYIPGVECNNEVTSGAMENIRLISSGKADLAMESSELLYQAFNGLGLFEDEAHPEIRLLMSGHKNYSPLVVLEKSGINSLSDVKGKRISIGPKGTGAEPYTALLLKLAGVNVWEDCKVEYLSFSEQVSALKDGNLDVGRVGGGLPTAALVDLSSTSSIRILPVPEDIYSELSKGMPWINLGVIPAGFYKGVDEDVNVLQTIGHIIVREDFPEDLLYEILDTIMKHNDELKEIHPAAGEYNLDNALLLVDMLKVPLHSASEKYFKDAGILK